MKKNPLSPNVRKIFVLNCGSSSIKGYLYAMENFSNDPIPPLWTAQLEWKEEFTEPSLEIKNSQGATYSEKIKHKNISDALKHLMTFVYTEQTAVLDSLEEIDVIGHRIVHGGRDFKESIEITPEVKKKITSLADLAPLHQPIQLQGIEILEKLLPNKLQVAVFDTAFHHTLPQAAKIYPGPYRWYEECIQRYGFHGISFQYASKRAETILKSKTMNLKMVICHLGSGASLCAIKEGQSIDTTMGYTPLDGLMMDTRCGSVDPGILLHLMEMKGKTCKEISHELYHESGLLGISGASSDMRDIIEKSTQKDPRASLALDIYMHRLNSQIAAMISSLQGIDVLVFTGGIGENAALVREKVCENFSFLGMHIDKAKNEIKSSQDRDLSASEFEIKILLIHAQEAFEIAKACLQQRRENKRT